MTSNQRMELTALRAAAHAVLAGEPLVLKRAYAFPEWLQTR